MVERVGTTTGWPFGRYTYTGRLRPAVAGVPIVVPAAWWAMALPAREVAHAVLGPIARRRGGGSPSVPWPSPRGTSSSIRR